MKKQILIIVAIILILMGGIFGFCSLAQAQVYENPGVYVTELKTTEITETQIRGEFDIWNSENYYLLDLNYTIKLFEGRDFNEFRLIDARTSEEVFFLPPNEKISKFFDYEYPQNIISGEYTLRIGIITEKGTELGWKDVVISLEGKNQFLEIDPSSPKILVRGEEFMPLIGVKISPTEEVVAVFQARNPGREITVVPTIKIFKRQFNMSQIQEYEEVPITFAQEESRELRLKMPELDLPESYLAEIRFYKNGEPVSGPQYFRWVVEGEGGKVLSITTDKDYYKKGETMEITTETVGPADLSDIGEGRLEVIVYDKDGNVVGQTLKDVALNPDVLFSKISIPVEEDLIFPRIEAKLIKNENVLDEHKIELPVFSEEAKAIKKELEEARQRELEKERSKFYLPFVVLVIVLTVGFLVYKFIIKKEK